MNRNLACCLLALLVTAAASADDRIERLAAEVRATETAFAATLAARDLAAFQRFLAADAVFIDDPVARGPAAIIAAWRGYFDGPSAPFSWAPDTIAVLDSGHLALSSGPVLAPDGRRVGTFNSVWRLERDGRWRIVLDHGCPACRCPPVAPAAPAAPAVPAPAPSPAAPAAPAAAS
jgi:ketosteroid isomerase-like protein